jgi:hypothetical protein
VKTRNWLSAVIGLWFIISPWVLGVAHYALAAWLSVIVGGIQFLVSAQAATKVDTPSWKTWQNWVATACGFWFFIHPFLGEFEEREYYAVILPAILTICLNLWNLMDNPHSTRRGGPKSQA